MSSATDLAANKAVVQLSAGSIAETWTLEDNLERLTQLGLLPTSA